MNLSDIVNASRKRVPAVGEDCFVRGLSAVDIEMLINRYRHDLEKAFSVLVGAEAEGQTDLKSITGDLIKMLPTLGAAIIAVAMDEPDNLDDVERIPFGTQVVLFEAIVEATAGAMEGGMGKVIETVTNALFGTAKAARNLTAQ